MGKSILKIAENVRKMEQEILWT